jgi:hypothetical protein
VLTVQDTVVIAGFVVLCSLITNVVLLLLVWLELLGGVQTEDIAHCIAYGLSVRQLVLAGNVERSDTLVKG